MSKGFYPASIVSVAVLHCWHCVQGLEALLYCVRERAGCCWGGRGRMQPMMRKVGGEIVNPSTPPVAVEAGPPCTIYNSRVQSGVCVYLPGIH